MTLADGSVSPTEKRLEIRTSMLRLGSLYGPPALALALAIFAWHLLTAVWEVVPPFLLPSPGAVMRELVARGPRLLVHTKATLLEILLGYAAGILVGFSLAVGVVYSRTAEKIIMPLILSMQMFPKLAIAPLLVVWFGFSALPKVLIAALIALFPILINTIVGLDGMDPRLDELFRTLSASERQIFFKARLPSAMPHIFAGLKIGITLATVGAVVAEWVGSDIGLGYLLLLTSGRATDLPYLFATIFVIALVGLVLFGSVGLAEMLVWPHARRKSERLEFSDQGVRN